MSARKTLLVIGEDGFGKRFLPRELLNPDGTAKKRGGRGVKVTSHPPLAAALLVRGSDELVIATRQGKIIRLAAADVPIYHREARGVRVVRLHDGDQVAAVAIAQEVRE